MERVWHSPVQPDTAEGMTYRRCSHRPTAVHNSIVDSSKEAGPSHSPEVQAEALNRSSAWEPSRNGPQQMGDRTPHPVEALAPCHRAQVGDRRLLSERDIRTVEVDTGQFRTDLDRGYYPQESASRTRARLPRRRAVQVDREQADTALDRKSTRLNSSH